VFLDVFHVIPMFHALQVSGAFFAQVVFVDRIAGFTAAIADTDVRHG